MNTTELNKKNRVVSMLLDYVILTFILGILEAPAMVIKLMSLAHAKIHLPGAILRFSLYDVFVFSLYLNKDIFLSQSIAKRVLGFRVLNNSTGQPAGPLRCLVRNFTILLWPVEVIAALVNIERRIGDYIAGTRLGVYDAGVQARPNWGAMVVCIAVSMGFTYVTWFYPVNLLVNFLLSQQNML